ncbi:MAG: HigA family addiction module antidote protein [Spirochaetaceae bacterium]|jgi:addiction module HigA family antidote|nr:HigA family addiction module antidote protein [Spirochaetaceae bacterium]
MAKGTGSSGKTPGTELNKLIEQYKLSVRATAIEMGETPIGLKSIIDGKRKVSAEIALKLEKVFGKKAAEWLQLQQDHDLAEAKSKTSLQNKIAKMKKAADIESGHGRGPKPGSKKGAKAGSKKSPKAAAKKGPKPKAAGAKRGPKPKSTPAVSI